MGQMTHPLLHVVRTHEASQWQPEIGLGRLDHDDALILYGYVSPYEDKVPLNRNGFSPAIIPAIGYQLNAHDSVQIKILGNAGLMFSYGRSF